MSEIVFTAIVFKVQTLIDNGVRVTLDLPEDAIPQMAMLAETRRQGIPLVFTAKAEGEPHGRKKSGHDNTRPKER